MNFFKKFGECSYNTKGRDELFSKIGTHFLESQKSLFQTSILLEKEKRRTSYQDNIQTVLRRNQKQFIKFFHANKRYGFERNKEFKWTLF